MDDPPSGSRLLIAAPWLRDPHFARTVVLVCLDGEEGSLGLVLNRPLAMTLRDGLGTAVSDARADLPIFGGGPVASTSIFALHNVTRLVEESRCVVGDVRFMPGSSSLLALLEEAPATGETVRVYAGCAGWSPGQLESEIADDAWLVTAPSPELLFPGDATRLWRRALTSLGAEGHWLATMPDDLRMN